MSKYFVSFLFAIVLSFFSCYSDDDDTELGLINMRVNYFTIPCEGVFPTHCIQIQEGNEINGATWSNFFGTIEGFDFEAGYTYDLQVEKTRIENPPADGSSFRYRLEQIISKTEVDCSFENPVTDLEWLRSEIIRRETQANDQTKYCYISQGEYQGEPVFLYFDCNPVINKVIPVFDCLGRLLGYLGQESIDPTTIFETKIIWQPEDFACFTAQ